MNQTEVIPYDRDWLNKVQPGKAFILDFKNKVLPNNKVSTTSRTVDQKVSSPSKAPLPAVQRDNEIWLTIKEAASRIGVDQQTIYRWVWRKKIARKRFGGCWRIPLSAI